MNNINLYWHPVLLSFESDRRTRRADYLSQAFKRLLVNSWHLLSSNLALGIYLQLRSNLLQHLGYLFGGLYIGGHPLQFSAVALNHNVYTFRRRSAKFNFYIFARYSQLLLLANVNFAICCRPSVCRLSLVCNVRAPYSAGWNFRQCFYQWSLVSTPFLVPWPSVDIHWKFYEDRLAISPNSVDSGAHCSGWRCHRKKVHVRYLISWWVSCSYTYFIVAFQCAFILWWCQWLHVCSLSSIKFYSSWIEYDCTKHWFDNDSWIRLYIIL